MAELWTARAFQLRVNKPIINPSAEKAHSRNKLTVFAYRHDMSHSAQY
jgi:hypothetical protein